MLLRRLEAVRAHDGVARIVAVAVAPRGRARRIVADRHDARVPAALCLDGPRAVAAEVARVAPERFVLVEILRREEVDGQRLDAGRARAVPRRPFVALLRLAVRPGARRAPRADDEIVVGIHLEPREIGDGILARNRADERRGAADALEADVRHLLRVRSGPHD